MVAVALLASLAPWGQLLDPPGLVARMGRPGLRLPADTRLLGPSPDGRWLYIGRGLNIVERSLTGVVVADAATGRVVSSYLTVGPDEWVARFGLGRDGLTVLIQSRHEDEWVYRFRLLDPQTGKVLRSGKPWRLPDSEPGRFLDFSRSFEGRSYVTFWGLGGGPDTLLVDAETGTRVPFDAPAPSATEFEIDPGNRVAVCRTRDRSVRAYHLPGGKLRAVLSGPGERAELAGVTPDGRWVAAWVKGKAGWSFELWDPDGRGRRRLL